MPLRNLKLFEMADLLLMPEVEPPVDPARPQIAVALEIGFSVFKRYDSSPIPFDNLVHGNGARIAAVVAQGTILLSSARRGTVRQRLLGLANGINTQSTIRENHRLPDRIAQDRDGKINRQALIISLSAQSQLCEEDLHV